MQEWPIFTLDKADEALSAIIALTANTLQALDKIAAPWNALPFRKFNALRGVAEEDWLRAEWSREVARIGAQPKGYFTVDFQSPDPETLFCWTYGEDRITHQHKVWESFADRRPLSGRDFLENPST